MAEQQQQQQEHHQTHADLRLLARTYGGDLRKLFPTLLSVVDPSSTEDHVVCQPPVEGFKVRGPNYLNDRVKIKRPDMKYTLIGIDYVRGNNDRDHSVTEVARIPWLSLRKARERGFTGFVFVINFIVGFGNFICYWTPTRNFKDFRAAASVSSPSRSLYTTNSLSSSSSSLSSQSSGASSQASSSQASSSPPHDPTGSISRSKSYSVLAKDDIPHRPTVQRAQSMPPQENLKPYLSGHKRFDKLMRRFVEGDDEYRNSRLKIIPICVEGNYFLRNFVGRPAIVCNKIETQWIRDLSPEQNFLEADVLISSSSMALTILGLVRHYILTVSIDMTFVLEGKHEVELPEELFCGLRFRHIDPDNGPHRDELAREYELQQAEEASESKNSAAGASGSPAAPSDTNGVKPSSDGTTGPVSSGADAANGCTVVAGGAIAEEGDAGGDHDVENR